MGVAFLLLLLLLPVLSFSAIVQYPVVFSYTAERMNFSCSNSSGCRDSYNNVTVWTSPTTVGFLGFTGTWSYPSVWSSCGQGVTNGNILTTSYTRSSSFPPYGFDVRTGAHDNSCNICNTGCQLSLAPLTVSFTGYVEYNIPDIFCSQNPDNLLCVIPSCSQPVPVSAEACKGGQGLWLQTSALSASVVLGGMFGDLKPFLSSGGVNYYNTSSGAQFKETFLHYQNTPYDTLTNVNGSQCVNNSEGQIFGYLVCPLGFETEPDLSSSSASDNSSSSGTPGESSSSSQKGCKFGQIEMPDGSCFECSSGIIVNGECQEADKCRVMVNGVCVSEENPETCSGVMVDGKCFSGPPQSSSSGSGGDGDGNCSDLSNCDWAKVDVQLAELGVAIETRDAVRNLIQLSQAGYNVSEQQLQALQGLRSDLIGSVGSGTNEIVNSIDNLARILNGSGGDGSGGFIDGISGGVSDGLGKFASDTTGQGGLDSLFGGLGGDGFGGGGLMGDSLGDGSRQRQKIKQAIGVDSTSFSFLGDSEQCPVIPLKFDVGIWGIKNDNDLDLCDVYGYNVAKVLRAILWLSFLVYCFFMDLNVLRSGGRS